MAESGILTRYQCDKARATILQDGSAPLSSQRLAEQLQSHGLLTPHQAKAIARGRIDDLKFGPYVILEQLGQGGMGQVFKARHSIMDRIVALKTIRSDWFENDEATKRFLLEARVLGRLKSHPNLVAAEFADRSDDVFYLVMEFVEGRNLHQLMRNRSEPLALPRACSYIRQAAEGLGHAHKQGVVHRDIKPENLMLSKDGVIKVLDLGLARCAEDGVTMTGTGATLGTPDYMSPEQCEDSRRADPRSDVYSLGCTLFFLCTGRPPFSHRQGVVSKFMAHIHEPPATIRETRPETPKKMEAICQKMMAKRPEDRFADMDEVVSALKALTKSGSSSGSGSGSGATARAIKPPLAQTAKPSSTPAPASPPTPRPEPRKRSAPTSPPPPNASPQPQHRPQTNDPAIEHDRYDPGQNATEPIPRRRGPRLHESALIAFLSTVCVVIVGLGWLIVKLNLETPATFQGSKPGDSRTNNGLGMTMIWCPPGRFLMGSPANELERFDDENQVEVTLTRGFWLGKHEVTQEEWRRVMGKNPSRFSSPQAFREVGENSASANFSRLPVESITWDDAVEFCRKLTQQEREAGRLGADWEYRLPTEAEWEYACRAGTTAATAFGNTLSSKQANFSGQSPYNGAEIGPSLESPAQVGSYPPNAWGLCDMHGNVWEWCSDWYGDKLTGGADPVGPETGAYRVVRGGTWNFGARHCRSASRNWSRPEHFDELRGFRAVIAPVAGATPPSPKPRS